MSSRLLLALLLAAAAAVACARAPQPAATTPMTETYWRLTELDGRPAAPAPSSPREPHLRLQASDQRAVGATGCNSFFARYTLDGERISMSNIGSTKMACLDAALNQQEQSFLRALTDADRATVAGDTLTLYQGERAVARFIARP